MKLTTEIPLPRVPRGVGYDAHILLLGSCFASSVGERFLRAKFDAEVNPFGVLFNPYSVLDAMDRIVERRHFAESDFFESDGRYLSLALHSDHSYPDADTAVRSVNALIDRLHEKVKTLTHVFFTYGTSEVYRYLPSGEICANCHKVPQKQFSRQRMSSEDIVAMARRTEDLLRKMNPGVTVFHTVSPVRYLSEGSLGNSASKGALFCALENLVDGQRNIYLPVYEVVMDELRDYRFFGDDMVHPNALAVDFLWEKLKGSLFSADTVKTMAQVEAVVKDFLHRPFNPQGMQYKEFCRGSLEKIGELRRRWPGIDFGQETAFFQSGLQGCPKGEFY